MKRSKLGFKVVVIGTALVMMTAVVSAASFRERPDGGEKAMPGFMMGMKKGDEKPAELTEEQKAEMLEKVKEDLAEKLESGEISEEDYNSMLEKLENGEMPFQGKDRGMKKGDEKPAELTEEQKAEMLEKAKEALAEKLESGEISEEDYSMLEKLENGEMPFQGKGRGHRRMPGGRGKAPSDSAGTDN